ncbi:class I SAM-dependent methyltransferase [Kocuria sp. CPCC 205292]|uniref:class I SAM-dependent methyltransferase n=1 Tax=Kocuria cellulosilytica TaxID=3071451 RepID=UPI0034D5E1FE
MTEHAPLRTAPDPAHGHAHGPGHGLEEELAHLLDLDAATSGRTWEEVIAWAVQHVQGGPLRIVDLGAGTGTGALTLARFFTTAEVVAVDRSAGMLDRVQGAARAQGLEGRVHALPADLGPDLGAARSAVSGADLVWSSSFLHEVADPGALLAELRAALRPGALLVVVELDGLPRFLPDDLGIGRPGLEDRCHRVLADAGWNAHPDWRPLLEQSGFEVHGPHTVSTAAAQDPAAIARYARAWIAHLRPALQGRLAAEDLAVLDRLLTPDAPEALPNRRDLELRTARTVWAARA